MHLDIAPPIGRFYMLKLSIDPGLACAFPVPLSLNRQPKLWLGRSWFPLNIDKQIRHRISKPSCVANVARFPAPHCPDCHRVSYCGRVDRVATVPVSKSPNILH
jgi:hypothetical protein